MINFSSYEEKLFKMQTSWRDIVCFDCGEAVTEYGYANYQCSCRSTHVQDLDDGNLIIERGLLKFLNLSHL